MSREIGEHAQVPQLTDDTPGTGHSGIPAYTALRQRPGPERATHRVAKVWLSTGTVLEHDAVWAMGTQAPYPWEPRLLTAGWARQISEDSKLCPNTNLSFQDIGKVYLSKSKACTYFQDLLT